MPASLFSPFSIIILELKERIVLGGLQVVFIFSIDTEKLQILKLVPLLLFPSIRLLFKLYSLFFLALVDNLLSLPLITHTNSIFVFVQPAYLLLQFLAILFFPLGVNKALINVVSSLCQSLYHLRPIIDCSALHMLLSIALQ